MPAVTRKMLHSSKCGIFTKIHSRSNTSLHLKDALRISKAYNNIHYVTSWNRNEYPVLQAIRTFFHQKSGKLEYASSEMDTQSKITTKDNWDDGWVIRTLKNEKCISVWIPFEEYHQPSLLCEKKIRSSGFQDKHYNGHKFEANSIFCQFLKDYDRPEREVMALDNVSQGLTIQFIHTLLGILPERLHVPDIICDAPIHPHVKNKASFYQGSTVYVFIRDMDPKLNATFDFALDYCCTFEGNKENTIPKLDIELIFHNKRFPQHNGVLWLTFCCRSTKKMTRTQTLKNVVTFVLKTGKKYGYNMTLKKYLEYTNGHPTPGPPMLAVYFVSE